MSPILLPMATLFIDLLVVILFFSKKTMVNKETRLYSILILINFIECIFNVIGIICIKNLGAVPLSALIQKIDMAMMVIWVSLMFSYIFNISEFNNILQKKINRIIQIITMIIAVFIIILPCETILLDGIIDSKGLAPMFTYIAVALYALGILICVLVSVFKDLKNIFNKKYFPLYALIILSIIGLIVRTVYPSLVFEPFMMGYVLLMMYHTIENPDLKMIAELNEAKAQAEKANNAKSEFLSNMSHEIRTPLNAIVGFSQALEEEDISGEAKEEVRDIVRASQSLLEIVNGILDISKIEANKIEIVNGEYDIYEILDDLVALTKARMGDKQLDFRIDFDQTIPHVLYGDKTRIKQIILNLLTNSVKYTKKGYIEFKVSSVRKDDICRLIVSVEDSGIGIKEENLSKLFSKFERFDLEKNITIEGTGLGLAITKRLVELMHGKIVVQSIYGKGSRFTIAVDQKIVNKEKIETKEVVTDEIIDLTGKKILLVDDNNLNLKVASKLLEKYNVSITTLTSGTDCIEKIKTNEHFDLVLLDDMMPGMSGVETIQKLREMDNYNIPTIALTANAIEGVREKYINAGFDDYLSKPIEKRELNRVITKFMK